MSDSKQLSVPAVLVLGAISFAPVLGAGIAIAQHSLDPFGYGAVAAVGLFLAFLVGSGVAQAQEARTEALRAENEVHSGPVTASRDGGKTWEPVVSHDVLPGQAEHERDHYRHALTRLVETYDAAIVSRLSFPSPWIEAVEYARLTLKSWTPPRPKFQGPDFENRVVVRLGSESGKREPDVTDMTRSPDPDHPGA